MMQAIKRNTAWVTAVVLGVCLGAAAVTWSQGNRAAPPEAQTAHDLSIAFRDVANKVLPAVVSIESRIEAKEAPEEAQSPFGNDEFFKRFFGDDPRLQEMFRNPRGMRMPPREGRGSGVIIDSKGVILTNSHVVSGADRVVVRLHDGREVRAASWAADPRSDVAIVRVEVDQPLPVVRLGNSDAMQIGDWVLAMGNPFNVGTTVTAGIISATGRGPGINERESYLQTDAAINPGNSGGPLVNLNGEVVGINTAISTSSGGYDGVGFAIPVNMAHWVSDQLIRDGHVRRAYLGVSLQEMDNALRRQFGVNVGDGALVSQVMPNTPASKAGIQPGDVVTEMAGKKVTDRSQLQGIVEALEVGRKYPAEVVRDGKRLALEIAVEEMPGDFTAAQRRARPNGSAPREEAAKFNELGLEIERLTPQMLEQLGLKEQANRISGVLVKSVEPRSPAAQAGVQAGDIIEKVGAKRVTAPDEFKSATEGLSLADGVVLLVRRGDGTQFVVVKSDE
jgi:serine protease Do